MLSIMKYLSEDWAKSLTNAIVKRMPKTTETSDASPTVAATTVSPTVVKNVVNTAKDTMKDTNIGHKIVGRLAQLKQASQ